MPIDALIRAIFKQKKIIDVIDRATAAPIAEYLQKTLHKGFGTAFPKLQYGAPNQVLLAQLTHHTSIFTAFKNHRQQGAMLAALTNEKGKQRTFAQFRKEALKINSKYNVTYLRAEYQTALLQGEGASKWQSIVQTKERYPNIRYSAVLDAHTRAEHASWDGIVRPIDDPFWDTHFPPNGWNCRCTTHASSKPTNGALPSKGSVTQPFAFNAAKTGQIVDGKHPYFDTKDKRRIARSAKKFAIHMLRRGVGDWARKNLVGKAIRKDGFTAHLTGTGLRKIINQPHKEKYFQLLTLYDLPRLLRGAKAIKRKALDQKKRRRILGWNYYEVDVNGVPSVINIREIDVGKKTEFQIYDITEKRGK